MVAPIQALQTLANAADQAAALANGGVIPTAIATPSRRRSEADRDVDDDGEERGRTRKRKRVTIGGKIIHLRVKETRLPVPKNPFPDAVTKGLVSETEARELWDM
jgi:hypothetical protein